MTPPVDAAVDRAALGRIDEILDLSRSKLSEVPDKLPTTSERWMRYLGFPAGVAAFLVLYYLPTPSGLTTGGQVVIACFAAALVWWITEPIPTYLTSLVLMAMLVFCNGWPEDEVLGVLGFSVIWLNILAFILSSMLVKTNLAKRIALSLIVRFGRTSRWILLAFFVLNLVLAAFIPATAARAAILLPIILVVASIYGASNRNPNNFGRNLFLQNLQGINFCSSAYMTGSNANLIAVAFILSMGGSRVYYTDWLFAAMPVVLAAMLISWWLGPRLVFRIPREQQSPVVEGGIERMQQKLHEMGPVTQGEKKAAAVFGLVIVLWITDKLHMEVLGFEISAVMAAFIGAVIALAPRVGLLKWNEADIPWHLMLFSCGAYAGGLALNDTGAARWLVGSIFAALDIRPGVDFWPVYCIVIAVNMFSHIFFTSKTMRTLIFIPFVIAVAQNLGFDPLWLALPAALTIDWVIALPINAKPNVILFATGQYSVLDNLKYGLLMTCVGTLLLIAAGFTWFRVLGVTPGW
ncbi:MAG: DASS family sodium-coupled anion symporter [Krumholzibacteria bacterium]|nr:DASS family sodium-coupled anion symporter [Candidatus Krumholzibacteria bacterium]